MFNLKLWLHIEGGLVLLAACVFYHQLHGGWMLFALLLLTPDLIMLGYLINRKFGTASYNLVHTYAVPLLLLSIFALTGQNSGLPFVAIWFAHIGMDRMFGFGLKYETSFKDTHLQRL
jgi:hypothetical protein